jgi:hypothetical protein
VDKNNFISLLSRYSRTTVSEALEILALKQRYPYSQLLHALSAKVSKDHGFSTQQQELQLAAVYASDRSSLKEILSTVHDDIPTPVSSVAVVEEPRKASASKVEIAVPVAIATVDFGSIDLAETVIKDLQKLSQSRKDFELMFEDGASEIAAPKTTIDGEPSEIQKSETTEALAETENTKKSKKERIIELAKAKALESPSEEEKPVTVKKRAHPTDVLIQEIASTKKEIDPETEKQKAQIQIIDQFIKAQPNIVNSKDKPLPAPANDLSTIRSGEFGDNIVSETLVDILLKQGKKDKAIEVLKKLIWKFPQKKAYFAAQIEELKK